MNFASAIVVNPPSPAGYVSNKDSMGGFGQLYPVGATFFPPVDMPYLISYLDFKGHDVKVFECLGYEWDQNKLIEKINEIKEPSLIIIRTSDPTIKSDALVGAEIKKSCPQHTIAFYGPVVEHRKEIIENSGGADYLILGEANEPAHALMNGADPQNILNLEYKDSAGLWQKTGMGQMQTDLDSLPFPAWDRMPHDAYKIPKSSTMGELKFLPMVASRGCPYACNYCPYPIAQGTKWRFRSPQNVVDEIEELSAKLGVNYIVFRDPVFSLNQKWVKEICGDIVNRGIKVFWKCETRFDCVEPDTLEAMRQAGCVGINFGIESSDPDIQLQSGRKPITPDEIIRKLDICKDLEIKTFCFFIIGLPGDSAKSIMDTIQLALKIKTDWIQFTAASPLTGTKLRDWAISKEFIEDIDYDYINAHQVVMGNDKLSKNDIRRFLQFAKFIQNNIINRRGILKDSEGRGIVYKGLKKVADTASSIVGTIIFKAGKIYL